MNKIPFIEKASARGMDFNRRSRDDRPFYFFFFFLATVFVSFVLLLRLFQLTVVKGNYYRRLAEENRIREIVIEPHRGSILDRKGLTIASSDKVDLEATAGARITSRRTYENPEAAAHLLGYRQLADEEDLKADPCFSKLKVGSKVGKQGVEHLFECQLRGVYGKKLIEVDAHGKAQKTLTVIPARDGENIQLALDWELQQKAYAALAGKKAAVVAMKPSTGEILVMASAPSFSVQEFEDENLARIDEYLKDRSKPLFSRATEGVYPPGSVFKLAVAAGALEEKAIDEDTKFEDTGTIKAGPITFGNWYFLEHGKTEGEVDIIKGLQRSNDIFFYHTGAKLGAIDLKKWAERFGYGKSTGLPLANSEGTIPSPFWKEEIIKEQWYLGDTYNLSIGQGFVQATPLQVAQASLPFANGGTVCTPQLLKDPKPQCKSLGLSKKTMSLIREGMKRACTTGGTGWPLFDFTAAVVKDPKIATELAQARSATEEARIIAQHKLKSSKIQIGCKTGTAESHATSGIPHAWITAFAPFNDPEIAVTVMVEESGQGSDVAGPIARDILKAYFQRSQ